MIAYNPFAYCVNSPVVLVDPDGNLWRSAFHTFVRLYTGEKSLALAPVPTRENSPKKVYTTEPLIDYGPEGDYGSSLEEKTGLVIIGLVLFAVAVLLASASGGLSLAFAW